MSTLEAILWVCTGMVPILIGELIIERRRNNGLLQIIAQKDVKIRGLERSLRNGTR